MPVRYWSVPNKLSVSPWPTALPGPVQPVVQRPDQLVKDRWPLGAGAASFQAPPAAYGGPLAVPRVGWGAGVSTGPAATTRSDGGS